MLSGALEASRRCWREHGGRSGALCSAARDPARGTCCCGPGTGEARGGETPGHSVIRDLRGPRVLWWSLTPTPCFLCVCVCAHSVMSDSVRPHRL